VKSGGCEWEANPKVREARCHWLLEIRMWFEFLSFFSEQLISAIASCDIYGGYCENIFFSFLSISMHEVLRNWFLHGIGLGAQSTLGAGARRFLAGNICMKT